MITKKELEDYAKLRGMNNIGHAEKDYFQNILLFIIYKKFGKEIVFKGGTALSKCYGLNRFSEDLDFNCDKDIDFKFLEEGLKRFRIEFASDKKEFERSVSYILRIKGPLYNGSRQSMCKLILDFSLREPAMIKPNIKTIGRFLEEIPSFDVFVMAEEEILAEKIRAIITRNKARDVYDLYYLIEKGTSINKDLANKKLEYYKKDFNLKKLIDSIKNKKDTWKTELSGLIQNVPNFEEVFKIIKNKLGKIE